MDMTERDLAEWIMQDRGQTYVDEAGGNTMGAFQLAELHQEHCFKMGKSTFAADVECQAIRRWVECAGYGSDGNFIYLLSSHIRNC